MKSLNHLYVSDAALQSYILKQKLTDHPNLFIQVFTGVCEREFITSLLSTLTRLLPNAQIIGATTDGEIINGITTQYQSVISFSIFESTTVQTYITPFVQDSFYTGTTLLEQMSSLQEAKLLITFSQGLSINGEEYVRAIEEYAPDLQIAGGLAADNANFAVTYVFTQDGIVDDGAVGALFFGDSLLVNRHYNFSWEAIGRELTITKSDKNRVYTINNIPAVDIYSKYLGHRISNLLPVTGIEFPLVMQKGKLVIARAVLAKHEDGSLSFAGNVAQDEKVYFAYGNINSILEYAPVCSTHIAQAPVESIFIYSCMARKRLMGKSIEGELAPLNDVAPTVGFFTNGEFFHNENHGNELLNQTMTIVALSESSRIPLPQLSTKRSITDDNSLTVSALSHLISVTSSELQELNEKLEQRVREKTAQLRAMNDSLEIRLDAKSRKVENQYKELHDAQKLLLENEKFASLGTLVAGVAHEINTPVGLSVTGITHMKKELMALQKSYTADEMSEAQFKAYLDESKVMIDSLHTNLNKAASLVKSFKQVAVDQSRDALREFNLSTYIDETLLSLRNAIRSTQHTIIVDIDPQIELKSNPGAFSQIITNLLVNSIKHAFDKDKKGEISIKAKKSDNFLYLHFSDNGKGMSDEVKRQLFDPFFTTARHTGGSGLGMNIIYNIVTQSLHGSIDVQSILGVGTDYEIKIPL